MLSGSIEENVLALLCHSKEHASTVATQVKQELYSTPAYRQIAKAAISYLEEYNRPARHHLRDILETDIARREEGPLIDATIEGMAKIFPEMDVEFILKQVAHFVRKRHMKTLTAKAAELVDKDRLDEAQETLYSLEIKTNTSPGIWSHNTNQMVQFMDVDEEDFFSSGIEELDNRDCRPYRKTMMLMIAPPKKGKSWWLVNVGKQALMHNKKVLHISLENSEALTARRYVQSLLSMAKSDVGPVRVPRFKREVLETRGNKREIYGKVARIETNDTVTPNWIGSHTRGLITKKLQGLKTRGKLHIKEFATSELTLAGYRQYLDYLERVHQFIPDLVIMDYPDLMSFPGNDPRIALGVLFKSLRGVAVTRNHAFVGVTQGNRGSSVAKVVGTNMVAEDFSKIGTADTIITYNQTNYEKQAGLARILVAAARDADDQYMALISQAYAMGQFCLDSAFLTRDLAVLSKNATGTDDEEDED